MCIQTGDGRYVIKVPNEQTDDVNQSGCITAHTVCCLVLKYVAFQHQSIRQKPLTAALLSLSHCPRNEHY